MIPRRCPHCWRLADPVAGPGNDRCPHCLAPLDRSEACAEVEDLVRSRLYSELHGGILSVEPRAAGPHPNA
jgi:predicted amidophosphoribosyltransferase